jgi:hypothetical protein
MLSLPLRANRGGLRCANLTALQRRHSGARPQALNPESGDWLAFIPGNIEILGAQLRT